MKKVTSLFLVLLLALSLAACSSKPDKKPAVDAFNEAAKAYNELATLINENADLVDPDMLSSFQDMGEVMNSYSDLLAGNQELTQDQIDEIVEWSGEAEAWSAQMKQSFESFLDAQ